MTKQELIDLIDIQGRDINATISIFKNVSDYILNNRSGLSKKDIRNFCETYLLDTLFTTQELKDLVFKLTLYPSLTNTSFFSNALERSETVERLKDAFSERNSAILNGVLDYTLAQVPIIEEKGYADVSERLIATRRSLSRLVTVITPYHGVTTPISKGNWSDIDTDPNIDYLTTSLDELKEAVLNRINNFDCYFTVDCNETIDENTFHCGTGKKAQRESLLTFMDYVDTFVNY